MVGMGKPVMPAEVFAARALSRVVRVYVSLPSLGLVLAIALALGACGPGEVDDDEQPSGNEIGGGTGIETTGDDNGSIDLALKLSPGLDVASVDFLIEGNGITPRTGVIDARGVRTTISLLVGALPAGSGYRVTLTAKGEKSVRCSGTAAFSIVAGRNSAVAVDLDCGDAARPSPTGSVTVTVNRCPIIGALTASPTTITPGGVLALLASAFDPDPVEALAFRWTSNGGGTFSEPDLANTIFRTAHIGALTIKLTVSDGRCSTVKEVAILCSRQIAGSAPDGGRKHD